MEILFLNPFFPPWVPGGAEHSLEQMCIQFSKKGWDVQVLAVSFDDRSLDEKRSGYWIRWVRAPFDITPGQNVDVEHYFRTAFFNRSMLDRFNELKKPNIIIANNGQVYEIASYLAKSTMIKTIGIVRDTQLLCEFGACMDNKPAELSIPCKGYLGAVLCAITFQRVRGALGWLPIPAWGWNGLLMHKRRKKLRAAVKNFNHLVTISDALHNIVEKTLKEIDKDCITTIRNFSTKVEVINKSKIVTFLDKHGIVSGKYFLFAGRKTYGKGADLLVAATKIVRKIRPECISLLVGRGELSVNHGAECIDIDFVAQDFLIGLLEHSAALVIPGRWQEGLHRTMIDAICLGIPVICTHTGAPPIDGVVHGKNGLVCNSNNEEMLAASMIEVLSWDSIKRDKCRMESYRIFQQRFADEVHINNWSRVISRLVNEKY